MANTLPIDHILNEDYQIVQILGVGGFGITYLARDIQLNTEVVIKEFFPSEMVTRDQTRISVTPFTKDTQTYEHLLKRFSEEAQLLARMRHPNVIRVTRFFEANRTAYFVMEYHKGQTLKEYLSQHTTLDEAHILSIMIPILEGAKYVHEQGFLHRDIAPDNIYLPTDGMPLLIDFGAARDAIAQESKNISSIVKEGYSAPEQYTVNNQQNASADLYAIGAVFYRMITGNVPLSAPHRQTAILNDEPDPIGNFIQEYKDQYSQTLLHATAKAMNLRASDRFDSVAAMQEALLNNTVVHSAPAPRSGTYIPAQEHTEPSKGNTGILLFLLLLILAGAGGGYYWYDNQQQIEHNRQEQQRQQREEAQRIQEAKRKQDAEAKRQAKEAAKQKAEAEEAAKRQAMEKKQRDEEAKRQAEAKRKKEEEIQRQAEAKRQAEAMQKAEEEAKRQKELELEKARLELARIKREKEALELKRQQEEIERAKRELEAQRQRQAEAARRAEEEARRAREEAERIRRAEEERRDKEERQR
jgi:serine/threonine protein kinase